MRQAEIEKAKKQNIEAQKKLEEAEELAKKMEMFSLVMTIVCVALLACTLGAALPGMMAGAGSVGAAGSAGAQAGAQLAQEAVKKTLLQQIKELMTSKLFGYYLKAQIVKTAGEGFGEAEKAKIMAQAHQHELYAKIHEANADQAQDMIENEAEENKMIMESVNIAFTKAIDSLSRTHAATTKLNTSTKV